MSPGSDPCRSLLVGAFSLLVLPLACGQYHFKTPKPEGAECGTKGSQVWTCQRDCLTLQTLINSGQKITCSREGSVEVVCCPPSAISSRSYVVERPSTVHQQERISQIKCREYQKRLEGSLCKPGRFSKGGASSRKFSQYELNEDTMKREDERWRTNEDYEEVSKHRFYRSTSENNEYPETELSVFGRVEEDEDMWDQSNEIENGITGFYGIFNGLKADLQEFPHAAVVGSGTNEGNIKWECGGSLISERYVLTAAHCCKGKWWGRITEKCKEQWVYLGVLNYKTSRAPRFKIRRCIVHTNYDVNGTDFYNDIALLELDTPVEFNEHIAPACLHENIVGAGQKVSAIGWGKTGESKGKSVHLMKTKLETVANEDCDANMTKSKNDRRKLYNKAKANKQGIICAWNPDSDTCTGDSGGPLSLANQRSCLAKQVGITSYGPNLCDSKNYPGVYARISDYLTWIENIVWPTDFCHSCH